MNHKRNMQHSCSYSLASLLIGAGLFAGAASAQQAEIEELVVIGTNIEGMQVSNTSPVSTIGAEQMFENPSASMMDYFVQDMTANNSGSVASQEGFGGGNIEGARNAAVNLRGLGSENTLTLVNGMRTVEYAVPDGDGWRSVDINATMPSIAFRRAEIMLDGGGALYGTDAIAGVVNLVPNYGFDGVKIQYKRLGFLDDVGTGSDHIGLLIGSSNEDTSFLAAIEFNNQAWATSADLGYWNEDNDIFLTRDPSNENAAGLSSRNYIAYEPFANGGSRPSRASQWDLIDPLCESPLLGPVQVGADTYVDAPIYAGAISGNTCKYYSGLSPVGGGQTDKQSMTFMTGIEHSFSDDLQVEVNASFAQKDIVDHRFWGASTDESPFEILGPGQSALIPGSHPGVAYNGWNVNQDYLASVINGVSYMNFYEGEHEDNQFRIAAKLNWQLTDNLNLSIGNSVGVSNVTAHIRDFVPQNLQNALNGLGGSGCGGLTPGANGCEYFNPFMSALLPNAAALGLANSGAITDYIFPQDTRDWTGTLRNTSAVLSGTLEALDFGAGEAGFAIGWETREDRLQVDYDQFLNSGMYFGQAGIPLADFDTTTSVDAIMGELVMPITDLVTVQLAVRAEDYDIGFSSTNPKIGVNWAVTDNLTARASWGTSFKAPTVFQTSITASAPGWITTAFPDQNADQPGLNCSNPATAAEILTGCRRNISGGSSGASRIDYTEIYAGNPNLDPQESTNWSTGFDWDVNDSLSVSATYVSIEFDNLIDIPAGRDVVQIAGCTAGAGYSAPGTINGNAFGPGLYYAFAENGTSCFQLDATGFPIGVYSAPRNLANRTVEAVDFAVSYSLDTDFGRFSMRPNGTVFLTWEEQDSPGGTVSDVNGKAPTAGFGNAIEQYRIILPISWDMGAHRVTYTARGQSGIENTLVPADSTDWQGASAVTYTYTADENWRMSINASDMFVDHGTTFGATFEYTMGN